MHQRVRLDLPSLKPSRSSCSWCWSSGSGSRSNFSSCSSLGTPRSTAHTIEHTINKRKLKLLPVELEQRTRTKNKKNEYFHEIWRGLGGSILKDVVVKFGNTWRKFGA